MPALRLALRRVSVACCALAATASVPVAHAADRAVTRLAGTCVAVGGAPVRLHATGLGTFLLLGRDGRLVTAGGPAGGPEVAGPDAEWRGSHRGGRRFAFRHGAKRLLATAPATGCAAFPEADLGTTGRAARSVDEAGDVVGWADTHLHLTGDMRAGGRVFGGEPFDRFGVVRALGRDAQEHGADGSDDVTGNLLRDGVPFGTHPVDGWPTFTGWPTNDTNTHEQLYFRWLQRAWQSGLRLVVAETVEDGHLCAVEPRRRYSCDETTAIRGQIRRLRAMETYVDAQAGGRGRGFLRIVTGPAQARRVASRGKLAVVIGVESSFPLDCRDQPGEKPCTPKQVDTRLAALRRLGVSSLFVAHWADNGFAGAALEGDAKGKLINALQRLETGRWIEAAACPSPEQGEVPQAISTFEVDFLSAYFPAVKPLSGVPRPAYAEGVKRCNPRGLTPLGRHLIREMMRTGMLIETDHMSERAREAVLAMAAKRDYPVVSGHNGTGGAWSAAELQTLGRTGGIASQRLAPAAELAQAIVARGKATPRPYGVGLGTDTGGFATLPGPAADAATDPLPYPFRAGGFTFARQRTGERTFDLNADGVAHYGLLPDLLADMRRKPGGRAATRLLDRSAEAYLRMWERARR